jgi:hypothetical protein
MLQKFLKTVQAGKEQSLLEISRSMEISPNMMLLIVNDLTRRGYLQEVGADCGVCQTACSGCPASSGCEAIVKQWFLTEKGRAAVSDAGKIPI